MAAADRVWAQLVYSATWLHFCQTTLSSGVLILQLAAEPRSVRYQQHPGDRLLFSRFPGRTLPCWVLQGVRRSTELAILNANYIAKRLNEYYPVVYTGPGGLVAHECIVDLSEIKAQSGITVEDVAKRLVGLWVFTRPPCPGPLQTPL